MIRNKRLPDARLVLAAAGCTTLLAVGCSPGDEAPPPQLPYDDEYPGIEYAAREPGGTLGRFAAALADGDLRLAADRDRGYLDAVLAELEIDASSQALVFSRTSLQTRFIRPATPRAIYFNDDSYVAWTPGAPTLELAGFDPELGPVFYTLLQDAAAGPVTEREFAVCLRCHDTYGLSGGGVPRFLLGSGYTGVDGELVSHEAWILTSQATPLRSRWGGWYVTGQHGAQTHLGNIVVERAEDLQELESLRVGNIDDLDSLLDTSSYLRPTSDIVALLVLEHQVQVQNLISRLRFETIAGKPIASHVDALVDALLMRDAIALTDSIAGNAGFREYFESLGPFDSAGRSLRELELQSRLFVYPLSYLIYSEPLQALPLQARESVYARLREVLAGTPAEDGWSGFAVGDRQAVSAILRQTLPAVFSD